MKYSLLAIGLTGLFITGAIFAQDTFVTAGDNQDPAPCCIGEKPYEMGDRQDNRKPFATFEDCTGWVVESKGAEASLHRTQDKRLFREFCGKLIYSATAEDLEILVRPVKPISIPEPWDCVNFWNHGAGWAWVAGSPTPLNMEVVVEGADQKIHNLPLGELDYNYWHMNHFKLSKEIYEPNNPYFVEPVWFTPLYLRENIAQPARFVGIRFWANNVTENDKDVSVYLGPIYFYKEILQPLSFARWPDKLPFPTREETILPINKTDSFTNTVHRKGETFFFNYRGEDCRITYRLNPVAGQLDDITVMYKGKEIYPCKGGGLWIAGHEPGSDKVCWKCISRNLSGDVLTVRWQVRVSDIEKMITYRYRIRQKSLIIEMEESDNSAGIVEMVLLGRAEPLCDPKFFVIPFLNYFHKESPRLLYSDGLFFFTQFDWYYTNASNIFAQHNEVNENSAVFNDGVIYIPKTNGQRNPLRERLFINVSDDVHEVFPTIPNPKSPMRSIMADRLWMTMGVNDHKVRIGIPTFLRSLGIERVAIRYHENCWSNGDACAYFRYEAPPEQGGDKALRNMVATVQSLGWLVGLYTDYCVICPVNQYWNEDVVLHMPRGEWLKDWPRAYAPKPMFALEMEAKLAAEVHAKFGTNHSYCDVHTALPPSWLVDYDYRVPGAATLRRTFECYGLLLLNEKLAHKGPVFSEGGNHWWYAGLVDGNYARWRPPLARVPLFVDFHLLKIHPLEMDAGDTGGNHEIAVTFAYGLIGQLLGGDKDDNMKRYYMIQPVQSYYTMVPVKRIAYEHDGTLLNTSEALITDAYLDGRVHVEYENGTKIWVNDNNEPWTISAHAKKWQLVRDGYLVLTEDDDTFSYSGMMLAVAGHDIAPVHVDICCGPVSHYLDTRGKFVMTEMLACQGAAALKKESSGWELIGGTSLKEFGFEPELIGLADTNIDVEGLTQDGLAHSKPELRWSRGKLYIIPGIDKAFKYRILPRIGPVPAPIKCRDILAYSGETIRAELPGKVEVAHEKIYWLIEGKRQPAKVSLKEISLTVQIPDIEPTDEHIWLCFPTSDGNLWLDLYYVHQSQNAE